MSDLNNDDVDGAPDGGSGDGGSSDVDKADGQFKAITSQEDFDKAVQRRIARAEARVEKKYEGFDDIKAKAGKFDELDAANGSEIEKLTRRAEKAERERDDFKLKVSSAERKELISDIADELGLPKGLRKRVQGDSEEDIRSDIEDLLGGLPKSSKDDGKPDDGDSKGQPPSQTPKPKMTFTATGDESDQGLELSADDILKDVPRGGGFT